MIAVETVQEIRIDRGNKMDRKSRRFSIGTIVRHFKGGIYRIEDFARHTENNEMLVIYRQMTPPYYCYARPEEMFCSRVDRDKYPYVGQEFRFVKLSKEEAKEYGRQDQV